MGQRHSHVLSRHRFGGGRGRHPADVDYEGRYVMDSLPARSLQLQLQLVDHQMVDRDGRLCGNVDDLELEIPENGSTPYVSAILSGPAALAPRLEGRLG